MRRQSPRTIVAVADASVNVTRCVNTRAGGQLPSADEASGKAVGSANCGCLEQVECDVRLSLVMRFVPGNDEERLADRDPPRLKR